MQRDKQTIDYSRQTWHKYEIVPPEEKQLIF